MENNSTQNLSNEPIQVFLIKIIDFKFHSSSKNTTKPSYLLYPYCLQLITPLHVCPRVLFLQQMDMHHGLWLLVSSRPALLVVVPNECGRGPLQLASRTHSMHLVCGQSLVFQKGLQNSRNNFKKSNFLETIKIYGRYA